MASCGPVTIRATTPQVFGAWERYCGAGEWARTTDLLITNKLLRRTVGRVSLTHDAYIEAATAWAMATIQACFGRCGLCTQQGDKRSTARYQRGSPKCSAFRCVPTFANLADRTDPHPDMRSCRDGSAEFSDTKVMPRMPEVALCYFAVGSDRGLIYRGYSAGGRGILLRRHVACRISRESGVILLAGAAAARA